MCSQQHLDGASLAMIMLMTSENNAFQGGNFGGQYNQAHGHMFSETQTPEYLVNSLGP